MDKKSELIHRRNMLMAKLLWICLALDVITIIAFYKFDHLLRPVPVPAGIVIATTVTMVVRKKWFVKPTMYLIMVVIYLYLFELVRLDPFLSNFVFIWFGLVLSSLYHDYRLIISSGLATILLTNYFFFNYHEQLFRGVQSFEVALLNLFGILITIILVITSKFSEDLRLIAEKNETDAVGRLQTHQQFTESFFNSTSDAIEVTDLDGTLLLANRAFENMFGWDVEEAIGENINIIPIDREDEAENLFKRVKAGEHVIGLGTERVRRDGTIIDVSVTVSPVRDNEGYLTALSYVYRDITEHRKTEEILRKSDKLSVVGQLAAGVAHEVRNPLTAVKGFVQILKEQEDQRDGNNSDYKIKSAAYYDIMLSEIERIETIIREFLLLSKPQMTRMVTADISQLLSHVIVLAETRAAINGIRLEKRIKPGLPSVECDENQLKQVFVNILKNAIEATPDAGSVIIAAKMAGADRISIEFIDHGCGIPEDRLGRLGEPFYSTKEKGTGLGLLVSYKIIENHRGHINVTSRVGEGTTFEILLPLSQS